MPVSLNPSVPMVPSTSSQPNAKADDCMPVVLAPFATGVGTVRAMTEADNAVVKVVGWVTSPVVAPAATVGIPLVGGLAAAVKGAVKLVNPEAFPVENPRAKKEEEPCKTFWGNTTVARNGWWTLTTGRGLYGPADFGD